MANVTIDINGQIFGTICSKGTKRMLEVGKTKEDPIE